MTLLAIDPGRSYKGEKTIGWALYTDGAGEWMRGEMSWEELVRRLQLEARSHTRHDIDWDNLDAPDPDFWLTFDTEETGSWLITEVVIEDFINNPKSRGGQRNGTSETIGAVEIASTWAMIPFTRQPSSILGTAKLLADYQGTLQHLPHQDSAYLHGYYYLVGKGVLQSKGLSSTL